MNGTQLSMKAEAMRFCERRFGQEVYRDDICKALGINAEQARSVMYQLAREGVVQTIVRGQSWRAMPAAGGGELYERIAVARDGTWVLQDENGQVVLVREVKR